MRRGVGSPAIAGTVGVIAIIGMVALAYYLASPASDIVSTSSTHTTKSTTTHVGSTTGTSTSSTTITSVSTQSCGTSTATTSGTGLSSSYNPIPLFTAFTSLTVSLNDTYLDNSGIKHTSAVNTTYRVMGNVVANASTYTKVNMTESLNQGTGPTVVNVKLWFFQNGTAAVVEEGGHNATGAGARLFALSFLQFEVVDLANDPGAAASLNSVYVQKLNTTQTTISGVAVSVDYYAPYYVPFQQCGDTTVINSELIGVGTVSTNSYQLLTYVKVVGTEFGALYPTTGTFIVTALTPA